MHQVNKGLIEKSTNTFGTLNQQGWPRRVWELSIISSRTRKYAWSCKSCQERLRWVTTTAKKGETTCTIIILVTDHQTKKWQLEVLQDIPIRCTNQAHIHGGLHLFLVPSLLLTTCNYQWQIAHDSASLSTTQINQSVQKSMTMLPNLMDAKG